MNKKYNPWPLGKLPKEFQRPEIDQLREKGYEIVDPREAITLFEEELCKFTGAPRCVVLDNCTDAIFLILKWWYMKQSGADKRESLIMPARTYISAPQSAKQAGWNIRMVDYDWSGAYQFDPLPVYDAAARFTKDMYIPYSFMCLSFQIKKRLPIGKGGAILLDDPNAETWLRKMIIEGRDTSIPYDEDQIEFMGHNMYMTPEDAARGILLLDLLTEGGNKLDFEDTMNQDNYTDLRNQQVFK